MPIDDPNPSTGAVEEPREEPPEPAAPSSASISAKDGIGWFRRKKRAFLGKLVSNLVGENPPPAEEHAPLPGEKNDNPPPPPATTIRDEIEESGFFGGISNRIKRTADQYLQQKLDEIEQRIDQKLDEIDKRLSEWRDREIANRIRILKITLWVSVIVALISLIYEWVKVFFIAS